MPAARGILALLQRPPLLPLTSLSLNTPGRSILMPQNMSPPLYCCGLKVETSTGGNTAAPSGMQTTSAAAPAWGLQSFVSRGLRHGSGQLVCAVCTRLDGYAVHSLIKLCWVCLPANR